MLRYCIITCCLWWLAGGLHAQSLTRLEYFIDDLEPSDVPLDAPGEDITQSFTVNLEGVTDGLHFLGVRTQDENGKWSVPVYRVFMVQTIMDLPNIIAAEYFIDEDPGVGNGTAIEGLEAATDITLNFDVNLAEVSPGLHFLQVRVQDAFHNWSLVTVRAFLVNEDKTLENISAFKYFYVKDGEVIGEGEYTYEIPEPSPSVDTEFPATVEPLEDGEDYLLYVWAVTESGKRSLDNIIPFTFFNRPFIDIEATITNVSCFGASDGIITVSASGGAGPPFTYSLDGETFSEDSVFTDLPAGDYTIHVKDSAGDETTETVEVLEPDEISIAVVSQKGPTCPGLTDGDIEVSATGGTGSFSYTLNGDTQETGNFTELAAGTFTITAIDSNGCEQSIEVALEAENEAPPVPEIVPEGSNFTQGFSLTVTNASGSIQWFRDGEPVAGATEATLDVSEAGSYTVQVTNEAGCTSESEPEVITGINEIISAATKAYPVPANAWVRIEVPVNTGKVTAGLYNLQGKLLFENKMQPDGNSFATRFEVSALPTGLYMVVLQGDDFLVRKKIQKVSQ